MANQIKRSAARERAVAFVVVRISSSRLPGKQLRLIGDRPLLRWITDHLRDCEELDEIVITTVAETANEPLREFAQVEGLPCFWYEGAVDHVTTRLRRAAEALNADICVLISGDCPLVYAPAIDHLVHQFRIDSEADLVRVVPDELGQPPALEGVSVARKRAWQLADDLSDRPELKEHQFPVIGMHPELFKTKNCSISKDLYAPSHRLSVDTWADLEFMNKLYEELTDKDHPFELPEVLALLKEKPELREINAHVHQRRLMEDVKRVLLVADVGQGFGYGHFTRSMELALQIVERLGWPVTFLVDDEKAATLLEERGLEVMWGALGRQSRSPAGQRRRVNVSDLVQEYGLLVLDIYWQRDLLPGWRSRMCILAPVIILNRIESWAIEADQVIIPEVKGCMGPRPELVGGLEYVILRREVRNAKSLVHEKDIDILAYLHRPEQREAVVNVAYRQGLKASIISGFRDDFPQLLARSRLFLSGFGYSFYEALFLNTLPITWPLTDIHANEALFFYQKLGMVPLIVQDGDLEQFLCNHDYDISSISIEDGTPRIVNLIEYMANLHEPLTKAK